MKEKLKKLSSAIVRRTPPLDAVAFITALVMLVANNYSEAIVWMLVAIYVKLSDMNAAVATVAMLAVKEPQEPVTNINNC